MTAVLSHRRWNPPGTMHAVSLASIVAVRAVIAVGTPLVDATDVPAPNRDAELDARSACPVHRARLSADEALNDLSHRSVVAEILQFRERVRSDSVSEPIIGV
ncbi:MAG: hypothetical protein JWO57_3598 [Pseudonocardiales bacterium]|nr:hypothetical protein [Pseudonocardiales bacterium]